MPMIIGEIRRYLRDNSAIRVSRSTRDTAYRALSVREKLGTDREPTVEEIAKEMGLKKEEVVFALDAIMDPISLFEPVYTGSGGDTLYVMDQISDNDCTDDGWVESISLREAMRSLGEREKRILALRFFRGKTQMEVAEEIGISQAQVSRLEKSALDYMREHI